MEPAGLAGSGHQPGIPLPYGDAAGTEQAFRRGRPRDDHRFSQQPACLQLHGNPGCLAEWDEAQWKFTLTLGSQGVHGIRKTIAKDIFGMELEDFRVITRDVGGGFGTKSFTYREYPLSLESARRSSAVRSNG
jgi:carbon-monoxide dehydrogenase large subunit